MTFTHVRLCILLAILRTVPCVTVKMRTRFPFARRSQTRGNGLEASTSRWFPLGAYHSSPEIDLCISSRAECTWCFSAYNPRNAMSTMHASPADAVRIFKDLKAKKALAMHWGYVSPFRIYTPAELYRRTWMLTLEPVLEPPALLRKECEKAGVGPEEFLVPALGETVFF